MALWKSASAKVSRSGFCCYRPLVEILEERNLLSFVTAESYAVSGYPEDIATGDFTGHGVLDLAVANAQAQGKVSVALGNGDGSFQAMTDYNNSGGDYHVAVADVNGDGIPDLVTSGSMLNVLLDNGDGTFQSPKKLALGGNTNFLVVADLNGDGIPDVVTSIDSGNASKVEVLQGNGDGTFQTPQSYAGGFNAGAVAVGDFSGNGILDLAVADYGDTQGNYAALSILRGNGDGSFQALVAYAVGKHPDGVVAGGFTGNGILDLAVSKYDNTPLSILLGNGDGTFQAAEDVGPGLYPVAVTSADVNGDGTLDLITADYLNTVSVYLGNGDATFQAPQSDDAGTFPHHVAVGDFNGDGLPDLAVANLTNPGTVTVLLNAADWGTDHPALASAPRPAAVHAPAPNPLSLDPLSASVIAHDRSALRPLAPSATDQSRNSVPPASVPTESVQPLRPRVIYSPTPLVTTLHALDTVFARWDNVMGNILGPDLVAQLRPDQHNFQGWRLPVRLAPRV